MKLFLSLLLTLLLARGAASAAPVCDGWGGGNCIDPKMGGSSSSGGTGEPPVFFDGKRTKRAVEMIEECGPNPLCMTLRTVVVLPMGLLFDAPVYAVKGVGYGLYYGAIGLGKGAAGLGRGIAYPFKQASASRERKRRKAAEVVVCPQGAPGDASFDSYRAWEACKKDILRRQKALTRLDPSNRANELWCKGHIPLSFGPNTNPWLTRCNPGGALVPAAAAAAPPPAGGLPEGRKVVECGLQPFFERLDDDQFQSGLKSEIEKVFEELSAAPAQGRADGQQVYAISRNTAVKSKDGQRQAVVEVGIQRKDGDGQLHLSVQYSLTKPGEPSAEGQTIAYVSTDGKLTPVDVMGAARSCLNL